MRIKESEWENEFHNLIQGQRSNRKIIKKNHTPSKFDPGSRVQGLRQRKMKGDIQDQD